MVRKLIPLVVVAGALAAAGVAFSSSSSSPLLSLTHAYGGGAYGSCSTSDPAFCPPGGRIFALDAHGEGRTSIALGTWEYGPPGQWYVQGDVTCMRVVGNTAIIGGWVRESSRPELVGLAFATYVRDNGPPSSPTRDEASVGWFGGNTGTNGDFPTTFPQTCPANGSFADEPPVWFDVAGDIVVHG